MAYTKDDVGKEDIDTYVTLLFLDRQKLRAVTNQLKDWKPLHHHLSKLGLNRFILIRDINEPIMNS